MYQASPPLGFIQVTLPLNPSPLAREGEAIIEERLRLSSTLLQAVFFILSLLDNEEDNHGRNIFLSWGF
jgi:hypothetical protein